MRTSPDNAADFLQRDLLRAVSRSFYLSLRLLPRGVREPISLAYLLARATDTIADTAEAPVGLRLKMLPILGRAIAGEGNAQALDELRFSFAPQQRLVAERELIELVPDCIEWLARVEPNDRADIRRVLARIVRGQTLDLERFGGAGEVRALQTAAELEEYTYLVAGCVGEFWTEICARKVMPFSALPLEEMRTLGIAFGNGLQLTNILRDVGSDLRNGRCYLPLEELQRAGLTAEDLRSAPPSAAGILASWRAKAEVGLRAGLEYSAAVASARVRIATALPALIGMRTVRRLEEAGVESLRTHVKVSRGEVRSLLWRTLFARASPAFLRRFSETNSAAFR